MKKSYILILSLLIVISSCSKKNKKDDIQKPKDSINYEYNKLNVKELYKKENKFLDKIDFSKRKDISQSLYYKEDNYLNRVVYVKSSPYEVMRKFKTNLSKLTLDDKIEYLKLSLKLGKDEEVKDILSLLKNNKKATSIAHLLYSFDKNKLALDYLYENLEFLLSKKIEENKFYNQYFQVISEIKFIENANLIKSNNLDKFYKNALKKFPENKNILEKYISYLNSKKRTKDIESLLTSYLNNKNLKIYAINSLSTLYLDNKNYQKLDKLYKNNIKFPENKQIFNSYIQSLKNRKIWSPKFKEIVSNYNKNKNIDNFYKYYFSLKFNNKNIKNLIVNHSKYLLNNGNKNDVLTITKILKNNGYYDDAFILVNKGLIAYKNDSIFEEFLVEAIEILKNKSYRNQEYSTYYNFNTPDIIGGLLSLAQNQYKDSSFLSAIATLQASKDKDEDINYLYDNYKNIFKKSENKIKFVTNYFYYLKNISEYEKLKKLASILINSTNDNFLKLKTYTILLNISKDRKFEISKIKQLHNLILSDNKNNKEFDKYLINAINFTKNNFNTAETIKYLHDYLELYPNKEIIYNKLIDMYDYQKFYTKEFNIYKSALREFKTNSWNDKFSRFLIRKRMYQELEIFNEELLKTKDMKEYVAQLIKIMPNRMYYSRYNKYYAKHNSLFEKLYNNALNKYPFNRIILDKLFYYYTSMNYRNPDKVLLKSKYKSLLYRYMFIYPDLMKRLNNVDLDTELVKLKEIKVRTIPETIFIAKADKMRSRFEKAIVEYRILANYYVTDEVILEDTANLLKSLASSFYIENPSFLEEAELYFKRLTFLDRMESRYYISLAELYYELNKTDSATKTLFRALEYQKNKQSIYEDIANMFYDFYDYNNAIKTFNLYRDRMKTKNIANVFMGRLYELKKDYDKALDEYVLDLIENFNSSYQSKKRVKSLYRKKGIENKFLEKLSKHENKIISNIGVFRNITDLYIMLNRKKYKENLYKLALEKTDNIDIINELFNYYETKDKKLAEKSLLLLEKYKADDDTYEKIITFYQKNKDFNNLDKYFNKLITNNPIENDKATYFSLKNRYIFLLKNNKKYDLAIAQRESLIKDQENYEIISNKLNIAELHKLKNDGTYLGYILKLDKDYPNNYEVPKIIFAHYKNDGEKLTNYLSKLIKRTKDSKELTFDEKKHRIINYRNNLISELTKLKKYTAVQDQHIEILNRDPLDFYKAKQFFKYAKKYHLEKRLLNYYEKLSKKSFKNYKYMMLNGRLQEYHKKPRVSLLYYLKAFKIEPQMYNTIGNDIARIYIELKEYKKAYKIYEIAYNKVSDNYNKTIWLGKMFTTAMLMKDKNLVYSLAQKIAGNPNYINDKIALHKIQNVSQLLYINDYLDLSKLYTEKFLEKELNKKRVTGSMLYLYYQISLDKNESTQFIEYVFNKSQMLNQSRNYYSGIYRDAISRYIPDSMQKYSESEYKKVTKLIEDKIMSLSDKYWDSALTSFYLNSELYQKYYTRLYKYYQKIAFFRKRAQYKKIIDNGLLESRNRYEYLNTSKKMALYQYVWSNKKNAISRLKDIFEHECKGYGIPLYMDYLYKFDKQTYGNMTSNQCQYNTIKNSYIKHKEKTLALNLIDSQNKTKIWKLKQKLSVYNALNDYSNEGIKLYTELLKQDDTISEQLLNKGYDKQLTMHNWNHYLKEYSNYILKSGKDADKYIINIAELLPSSQASYRTIAYLYKDNNKYEKALEYLDYANKIKENSNINLDKMEVYYLKNDKENFNKMLNKLLEKNNIMLYKKVYDKLNQLNTLNNNFINQYETIILEESKNYDYHKLSSFIESVNTYYLKNNKLEEINNFRNRFNKEYKNQITYQLLTSPELDKKDKYSMLKEYVKNSYYDKTTWIKVLIHFSKKIGKPEDTIIHYNQYKEYLSKELTTQELLILEFKVNYWNRNLGFLLNNIQNYKKKLEYNYEYLNNIFMFIENEKDNEFKTKFYKKVYDLIKKDNNLILERRLNILSTLDKNDIKLELENYLLNTNYQIKQYQNFALKNHFIKIYKELIRKELTQFNKFTKKIYSNDDQYQSYIFALIKAENSKKLNETIKMRSLSLKELNKIDYLVKTTEQMVLKAINLDILSNNQDLLFIKAIISAKLNKYDNIKSTLVKLNHFKFDKFKLKLKTEVNNSKNIFNKKSLDLVKKALFHNPENSDLKELLLRTYIKLNMDKKAFFMLAQNGFAYKAFGYLVNEYLEEASYYVDNYNYGYSEGYENKLDNILKDKNSIKYEKVENILSNFKLIKDEILEFLYQQYKNEFSSNKKLGLHILYSLSKKDKQYQKEFLELKKSK